MYKKGDCVIAQIPGKRKRKAVVRFDEISGCTVGLQLLDGTIMACLRDWIVEAIEQEEIDYERS